MSIFMRELDIRNKKTWSEAVTDNSVTKWSKFDDIPAEILTGWTDERPSIWKIDASNDNEQMTIAKEIMFYIFKGLHIKKNVNIPEKTFFILFDGAAVKAVEGLDLDDRPGNTGIQMLDESGLHHEIVSRQPKGTAENHKEENQYATDKAQDITGKKLCDLIMEIIKQRPIIQEYKCSEFIQKISEKLELTCSLVVPSSTAPLQSPITTNAPSSSGLPIDAESDHQYQMGGAQILESPGVSLHSGVTNPQ